MCATAVGASVTPPAASAARVLDKLREHAGRERVRRPDHRRADGGQDDGYGVTERLGRRAGDAFDPVARDGARDDGQRG